MPAEKKRKPIYAVRQVWFDQETGVYVIHEQQVRPRRWWNSLTRPAGLLLVTGAVGWPIFLIGHGWIKAGVAFAVADTTVILLGYDLMRCGARKWL